jgi:segregation and condensation protein A
MIEHKPKENYSVNLGIFQGPLDLLLYLIRKDEIDIYDIPIAHITEQYMQYIEVMQSLNLELAGEYILMAATLIHIKARLLLPRDDEEGEESDPREELVTALLEYKKFKEAGEILREKRLLEERVFVPPTLNGGNGRKEKVVLTDNSTLYDMLTVLKEVLERAKQESSYEINLSEATIEERVEKIIDHLTDRESVTFIELFEDAPRKIIAILTFIAVLELAKLRRIKVRQSMPFAELRIYRGEDFNNRRPAIEFIREMKTY